MFGILLMLIVFAAILYVVFAKVYPSLAFRYAGTGERKARAEYGRIKRERPDSADAKITEAEFVENFIRQGPSPWKWVIIAVALMLVGIPVACTIGAATMLR